MVEGSPHGNGILFRPNREKYTGTFYQGKPLGFGIVEYVDGKVYEGEFKGDHINVKSIYY